MASIKKDGKVLMFTDKKKAKAMCGRFPNNTTTIDVNKDSSKFAVSIRIVDRHKLTQKERGSMVVLPENFYTKI